MRLTTADSMKVRLASAADDSKNVSAERVFSERPENIPMVNYYLFLKNIRTVKPPTVWGILSFREEGSEIAPIPRKGWGKV
jgi:hypothetical protein